MIGERLDEVVAGRLSPTRWPPRCWTASNRVRGYDDRSSAMTRGSRAGAELERLRAEVAAWRARAASLPVRRRRRVHLGLGPRGRAGLHPARPPARSAQPRSGSRASSRITRGIHPTMYRGRLWTMRQFAGFGTAEDTNERYKFLLERGQTGLSVAFDFPTLMGYDSDHPRSEGEVGKCGVAISSLADMETLFDGIPLDQVSTSMTINGPAAMLFCFYVAAAERQGVPIDQLQGTIQNDILKEYMAQHAWIYPGGAGAQDHRGPVRVGRGAHAQVEHHLDLRLPHPRGGRHRGAGAGLHAGQRVLLRGARPRPRARRGPLRARGSRSSGTCTTTSSRRSPSCGPRAGSGPGTCASATARGTRAAGRCGSTARPPASRSPRSSRTTTSCGWPTRRWRRCWAEPSRCTPTRWTRPWRCPPRSRCASRSGPSRSSPTRPACPTSPTRWAGRTTSRR